MIIEEEICNLVETLIFAKDDSQHQVILDKFPTLGAYNVLKFLSLLDRHRFEDYPETLRVSSDVFQKLLFFDGFLLQRYKLSLLLLTKINDERSIEIWNALRAGGKFGSFILSSLYRDAITKALKTYNELVIDDLNKFIANVPTETETLAQCKAEEKLLLTGGGNPA